MSNDQRQNVRMRTFLKGRILFNNGSSSMDCLIRDLSAAGARLELSETTALPEVFDLYIQHKDATLRSVLRWRRDGSVGITFEEAGAKVVPKAVAPPAAEPAAPDPSLSIMVRRIADLEAENAALRSLLATMGRTSSAA